MIEIKDLVKIYDKGKANETVALDGVSFTVETGSIVAVKGDMGSGKTTLLEILSGTETADGGEVVFDGTDILSLKGRRSKKARGALIGLILRDFTIIKERSVFENIEMPLVVGKVRMNKKKRLSACLEAAKRVGLFTKLELPAGELSGGQKQRVAIARALVTDPSYIIADEPTAGLDAVSAEEVLAVFKRLNEAGKTFVIVSNDDRVYELCDRVICLSGGHVV